MGQQNDERKAQQNAQQNGNEIHFEDSEKMWNIKDYKESQWNSKTKVKPKAQ